MKVGEVRWRVVWKDVDELGASCPGRAKSFLKLWSVTGGAGGAPTETVWRDLNCMVMKQLEENKWVSLM